jgi:integrase
MVNDLAKTLKPSTVRQIYSCLSAGMRRAFHDGLLQRNPCQFIALPKAQRRKPNFCTAAQIQSVIAKMDGSEYFMPIYLCLMLGLRRGEALGLKWDDIDGDNISVRRQVTMDAGKVVCKQLKTEHSERTLDLSKALRERLNAHKKKQLEQKLRTGPTYQDDGYVCAGLGGGVLHPNMVTLKAREFLSEIGATPGTHLHDLRHTYATLLYQAGYPIDVVADLLGHSDVQTAYKYYVGEDNKKKHEAAQKIDELFCQK